MLVTGMKTDSTATELKLGQTTPNMKVNIKTAKNMELVLSNGQTNQCTVESLKTIILAGKEFTYGRMRESTKENGKITKCMAKVYSSGKTAENMLVSTSMTKSKVTVSSCGLMVEITEVNGSMGSRMDKVHIHQGVELRDMDNGNKARE